MENEKNILNESELDKIAGGSLGRDYEGKDAKAGWGWPIYCMDCAQQAKDNKIAYNYGGHTYYKYARYTDVQLGETGVLGYCETGDEARKFIAKHRNEGHTNVNTYGWMQVDGLNKLTV